MSSYMHITAVQQILGKCPYNWHFAVFTRQRKLLAKCSIVLQWKNMVSLKFSREDRIRLAFLFTSLCFMPRIHRITSSGYIKEEIVSLSRNFGISFTF